MNTASLARPGRSAGRNSITRFLAAFACSLVFAAALSAAEPVRKQFDVPAGNAEATLRRFAEQAGIELVFGIDKIEGVETRAIKGEFTPRAALDQMLAGTGLVCVEDTKTGALAVRRDSQEKNGLSRRAGDATANDDLDPLVELASYEVRGYRNSLAVSLNEKRKATNIVDVITAEDVGKFPDTNVAESLSHVPGVTVDRLFGQGERVSILGTDPNLNRTLLNGQSVASGDWFILDKPSRQFNYTLLAPEVIGQAEVHKSPEARLTEGSIGGTIILSTRDPLKLEPLTFSGSMNGMANDRDKGHDGSVSQVASWRNSEGTFGILLGLQYSREHIRRDGVEALGAVSAGTVYANQQANSPALPVPDDSPGITHPDALMPNAFNTALFQQTRQRSGGNLVIALKPSDRLEVVFNGLDVKVDNDNFNSSFYAFPGWWRGGVIQSGTVVGGILDSATVTNNIGVMDLFNRKATVKTAAYDLKATYTGDTWSVSQQAGYTKATGGTQYQYYIEPLLSFPSGSDADVGTTAFSYTGGARAPGFSFADSTVANNPEAWTVGGPWWNGNLAADPERDSEKYGQIDGELEVNIGPINRLLAGLKYSDHLTSQQWYNISLTTLPFHTLADFGATSTPGNFLAGLPNTTSDMRRHVVIDRNLLGDAVRGASYGTTGMTMQQAIDAGEGFQPTESFEVGEEVKAGYVQANFATGRLSGNAGVRFVETKTSSSGYIASGSTVKPTEVDKKYTNVLPSVNIAYEAADDAILRFGVSQVIARPNYADLSSTVQLYDSILQGVGGNPHLDPYESTNVDLAGEYYFARNSVLAVNLFYKDISNYILKSNGSEEYFNENRGIVTTYTISRAQNAGGAKSKGAALSYQQTFGSGFGATLNYTYVDASAEGGRELPYASEHQVNFSPFYENHGVLVRLTYAWRSDYFTNVDRGYNVYTDAYTQLDANLAFKLTEKISLTLAATNLLDETYYSYAKVPDRMFQAHYKNGRRLQAGVHWRF